MSQEHRFQRGFGMLVILKRDDEDISRQAAQLIASAVRKKPKLTLGLATGVTMLGVYKHLVRLHKKGSLDFSRVVTFNLDEYLGLSPSSGPPSTISSSTLFHTFNLYNLHYPPCFTWLHHQPPILATSLLSTAN